MKAYTMIVDDRWDWDLVIGGFAGRQRGSESAKIHGVIIQEI